MIQHEDIRVEEKNIPTITIRDQQDRRSHKLLIIHKPTQNIHFILRAQGEKRINVSAFKKCFAANS